MSESRHNITDLLKKSYFWDIAVTPGKPVSERLVVERTFNFGTVAEVALVMNYYGREEVERILLNLNYLDPRTLNFVARFFDRPKSDFKCYTRKQLTVQHWDY
jgi:hypothetical protein